MLGRASEFSASNFGQLRHIKFINILFTRVDNKNVIVFELYTWLCFFSINIYYDYSSILLVFTTARGDLYFKTSLTENKFIKTEEISAVLKKTPVSEMQKFCDKWFPELHELNIEKVWTAKSVGKYSDVSLLILIIFLDIWYKEDVPQKLNMYLWKTREKFKYNIIFLINLNN